MPPTGPTAAHARLLEQQAFLRRLAASLVADPHRAEDLAQDATVIALERPPAHEGSMRAWLSRVVRNRAVNVGLAEERRRARELEAAPTSLPRTPDEIEASFQVQRRVIEAVDRLQEPYRTTILLRYYHDLGPSAIAGELGVPVSTVKSRLARGLARLREDLDGSQPDGGRAWAVVLAGGLGEAWKPATATALATGGIVMGAKLLVGAAAVGGALVLGGWWMLRPDDGPQAPSEPRAVTLSAPQAASETDGSQLQEPHPQGGRSTLEAPSAAPASDRAATAPPAWILALTLSGWSDEDSGPIAVEVSPGTQAEAALSTSREFATEITLDVGELFADAGERPDQLTVRLDHPAYLPAKVQVLVPQELLDPALDSGQLQAEIELVRAKAIVTGTVEIERNELDSQARVAIFALDGDRPASEPIETARPDAWGRFRLRADAAERHAVLALDERTRTRFVRIPGQEGGPGLRPDTRVLALERGEERDLGSLVLGKGLSIQGRVVGLGGSLPVPGQVRAGLQGQGRFRWGELSWIEDRFELLAQSAEWDENDGFRLPGLGPHAYRLSAMPGGIAERNINMSFGQVADEQVVVTAPAEGVLLTLDRACVTFEVLGAGLPLEGASLGVFHDEQEPLGGESWTFADAEGRVTLELDPRRGLHVEARDLRYGSKELLLSAEELLASDRFVIDLEGPPVEPAVLVVEPVVSDPALLDDLCLEVFLYDIAGTPPDQLEYARSAASWGNHVETAHVSPTGPFPTLSRESEARVIADLAAGSYFVRLLPQTAEPDGLCFLLDEAFEVELPPGERVVRDWHPRVGGVVRLSFIGTGDVRRARLLSGDEQELSVRYQSRGPTPDSRAVRSSPELSSVSVVHPALPPGLYLLRLRMGDRTDRTIPVQVEPGRVTDVEVDLGQL